MPRKPTNDDAIHYARFFLDNFIERTNSADHILPKNEIYSPFVGFCRVFPQFAKKKDGGAATDGVSRAAFNKICLEYFEEGMRKPARNGNPGALEANLAQQRRHFLRGRWRDPGMDEDSQFLQKLWATLPKDQISAAVSLLEEFSRWKPGPAGRGGERVSKKRSSPCSGDCSDEEEETLSWTTDVTCDAGGRGGRDIESDSGVVPSSPDSATHMKAPVAKRHNAGGQRRCASAEEPTRATQCEDSGLLDLLCMVASSVDTMDSNASSAPPHGGCSAAESSGCSQAQPAGRRASFEHGPCHGAEADGKDGQTSGSNKRQVLGGVVAVTPKREVAGLASPSASPPHGISTAAAAVAPAEAAARSWADSGAVSAAAAAVAAAAASNSSNVRGLLRRPPGSIASLCCSPHFCPAPPPPQTPPSGASVMPGVGPAGDGWRGRAGAPGELVPAPFASLFLEAGALTGGGAMEAAGRHLLRV